MGGKVGGDERLESIERCFFVTIAQVVCVFAIRDQFPAYFTWICPFAVASAVWAAIIDVVIIPKFFKCCAAIGADVIDHKE